MSIRLERGLKALDARVAREADAEVAAKDQPWADQMRQRAMVGDITAFRKLRLPEGLLPLASGTVAGRTLNPRTGKYETGAPPSPDQSYALGLAVDKAITDHLTRARQQRLLQVRARYAQHYDAFERAIQEAGGLSQQGGAAAPADESQGDPLLDEVMRRLDEEQNAPEEP
jgi:hypothetical protein